ncbi:hypothetical protein NIES267_54960 [Calothrix parasitica NIES-267]|uniref:Uncharacterized protein n=1 Tax=Calothrix parasitica NIES-267 TaxID=1973488 RepID=A0A1Z4LXT3_9CYAN|nr:hypothetical protein NIES267_54960 [Calothrix parasitica NIES-267]
MPLPNNFSEWENLQDLVRKDHNKDVREYFKNQADNDISTPKARLKHTCLIKDEDTAVMTQLRMWLFEITVGRAQAVQRPIYGIPVQELQRDVKFKPQIKLFFKEDFDRTIHDGTIPLSEGEITFRLMNESSETISRSKAESLARKIRDELTKPVLIWGKGWFKCTYLDKDRGYDFRLLVKSKTEGERVIKEILKIQSHSFDNNNLQFIDHDRNYPINPGTHRVYGRTVKKYRQRPRVDVRFKYAQLLIHGQQNAINLVAHAGSRFRSVIHKF